MNGDPNHDKESAMRGLGHSLSHKEGNRCNNQEAAASLSTQEIEQRALCLGEVRRQWQEMCSKSRGHIKVNLGNHDKEVASVPGLRVSTEVFSRELQFRCLSWHSPFTQLPNLEI